MNKYHVGSVFILILTLVLTYQVYLIGYHVTLEPPQVQEVLAATINDASPRLDHLNLETIQPADISIKTVLYRRGRALMAFKVNERTGLAIWQKGFTRKWRLANLRLIGNYHFDHVLFKAGGKQSIVIYATDIDPSIDYFIIADHKYIESGHDAFISPEFNNNSFIAEITEHSYPKIYNYYIENHCLPLILGVNRESGDSSAPVMFDNNTYYTFQRELAYPDAITLWAVGIFFVGGLLMVAAWKQAKHHSNEGIQARDSFVLTALAKREKERRLEQIFGSEKIGENS